MTIIIFIAVLVLLILVHELGHFLAAKKSGIKADEFGIGFPPRLITLFWWGETRFTLNALPFGGFVKIFGQDPDDESISGPDRARSMVNKPRLIQVWVLAAGVFFNFLLAWFLFSGGFMIGAPAQEGQFEQGVYEADRVVISEVLEDSPAATSGLQTGDQLLSITVGEESVEAATAEQVRGVIGESDGEEMTFTLLRDDHEEEISIAAEEGVLEEGVAIGAGITSVGSITMAPHVALWKGLTYSVELTGMITVAFADFIADIFTSQADYSQVAGPVGIVGLVGDAAELGFVHLMFFTAIISLHLAIINLLPFPALDGGRILFVAIEALKGTPIRPEVANAVNGIGFLLLLLLMLVVTVNDIIQLF